MDGTKGNAEGSLNAEGRRQLPAAIATKVPARELTPLTQRAEPPHAQKARHESRALPLGEIREIRLLAAVGIRQLHKGGCHSRPYQTIQGRVSLPCLLS